jgi:hypothetical protein
VHIGHAYDRHPNRFLVHDGSYLSVMRLAKLEPSTGRRGKLSDVKHTDRLGERELALRYLAWAVRVFLRVDRERHSL